MLRHETNTGCVNVARTAGGGRCCGQRAHATSSSRIHSPHLPPSSQKNHPPQSIVNLTGPPQPAEWWYLLDAD